MEVRMAEIMAEYNWQLAVIIGLSVVVGMMIGLLVAGRKAKKAIKNNSEFGIRNSELKNGNDPNVVYTWNPELATVGSSRHGEKVTICGAEWTVM